MGDTYTRHPTGDVIGVKFIGLLAVVLQPPVIKAAGCFSSTRYTGRDRPSTVTMATHSHPLAGHTEQILNLRQTFILARKDQNE